MKKTKKMNNNEIDFENFEIEETEDTWKKKKKKEDKFATIVKDSWYEIQWDYNWKKINHFYKLHWDYHCSCWKDLKQEPVVYRKVSSVWLLTWYFWLTEIYQCMDCALKKWETEYWAKIVKKNK